MHQLSNMTESTLVYSTEIGRIKAQKEPVQRPKGDGVVRIQKQTSGRKGAGVSVITGLDLSDDELKKLATELKNVVVVVVQLKTAILRFKAKNAIYLNNF